MTAPRPAPTPLEREFMRRIETDGPIPLEQYMALCLGHPDHGYYMGRDPFGRGGDFTTAPEISQIFGELIGIWCVAAWQLLGAPDPFNLVELGPGRGTLMADALRAGDVMPGFTDSACVHLVETSPALRDVQKKTLAATTARLTWHDTPTSLPDGPLIVVANEFFDALPVQQIERRNGAWHERMIGLDGDGRLTIGLAREQFLNALVPDWARDATDGAIAEFSPVRETCAIDLAQRIASQGGALLAIDYGHVKQATGDTVQAVRKHRPVDILHRPGECDLTAHVDFVNLEAALKRGGLDTHGPITQGQFLIGMGLREREETLKQRADARQRILISRAAQRLAAGSQMGHLFKVIAATAPGLPAPAPFSGDMPA